MTYCVTTALERIQSMKARIRIVQGGTSAGKTIAILLSLVNEVIVQPGILISVVSDTFPNLRRGVMRDFLKICDALNVSQVAEWSKTDHIMRFPNGSAIEFFSTDMLGALGARRDILFVNEANRIDFETFGQLETRTEQYAILDFNPVNEFWVHTDILGNSAFASKAEFLKLTYKDNEALSDNIISSIEMRRGDGTSNWWRVYGLGEVGSLEGNVYEGWTPKEAEWIRQKGKLIRYGLDFGFSNDETGLVAVYAMEDGALGVVEVLYEPGILPSQYVRYFAEISIDPTVLIVADGARPEIIAEINQGGFTAIAAEKGPGSVMRGIARVQDRQIYYAGENLEREFLTYAWRRQKSTGKVLDVPQDGNDHLMDALRYAVDDLSRPRFDF